ncbi:MAG: nuclease domain-containing protein [Phycisphaerales bacterium]
MDEIHGLERAVRQAEAILGRIAVRPASRMALLRRLRRLRGSDPLSSRTMRRVAGRGHDIRRDLAGVTIAVDSKVETFDIPEHRILVGMLEQIARRGQKCLQFMRIAIDGIEASRRFRDFPISDNSDGRTLFEVEDQPTIEHLLEGIARARQISADALRLRRMPLLRAISPSDGPISAGMFGQNPEYGAARRLVCSVRGTAIEPSGGQAFVASAKNTWRLFEQWAFLQIVESFRRAGLELGDWDESLRLHLKSNFILDFRRGLSFEGRLGSDFRLRIRYEPFVLGKKDAVAEGESIYRSMSSVPCTPDITIELQERSSDRWVTVYATVLDVKYSRSLKDAQWSQVSRYAKIRSVGNESQVKHIGIVYLSETGDVEVWDDTNVSFSEGAGLICEPGHRVDFYFGSMPGTEGPTCLGSFDQFAVGTLQFMRRHFPITGVR